VWLRDGWLNNILGVGVTDDCIMAECHTADGHIGDDRTSDVRTSDDRTSDVRTSDDFDDDINLLVSGLQSAMIYFRISDIGIGPTVGDEDNVACPGLTAEDGVGCGDEVGDDRRKSGVNQVNAGANQA
jgi:hypothetical protein